MNKVSSTHNISFLASIKLTPETKKWVLNFSQENQKRFFKTQDKLKLLESNDEILLSRKKTLDGKVIPVLTNLTTGAMVAQLNSPINKFSLSAINLIEAVANQGENFTRKLFSKNQIVIENSIKKILSETKELSIHPTAQQKLTHIELNKESNKLIKNFETLYPEKEIIFKLSNNEKLFIKRFDEGYIYYICNHQNMPIGKYFTVTYSKDGFRINYNEKFIQKDKVEKYFIRYTQKGIEKLKERELQIKNSTNLN